MDNSRERRVIGHFFYNQEVRITDLRSRKFLGLRRPSVVLTFQVEVPHLIIIRLLEEDEAGVYGRKIIHKWFQEVNQYDP